MVIKDKDYLIKNDLLKLFELNKIFEIQQEVFIEVNNE